METVPRRRPWAFVIYGMLVVCLTPYLSRSGPLVASPSSCEALRTWAAPYKRTVPTLDTVAAFDRPHRVAIFNAVGPDVRSALMQEHLRRWATDPGLSTEQRRLIDEGASLLTPALYRRPDGPDRVSWERFWARAEPAFAGDSKRPWFDLAPSAPATTPPARAGQVGCECNDGHPSDCGNGQCNFGGCAKWFGCGPGLLYWCNGTCAQAPTSAAE